MKSLYETNPRSIAILPWKRHHTSRQLGTRKISRLWFIHSITERKRYGRYTRWVFVSITISFPYATWQYHSYCNIINHRFMYTLFYPYAISIVLIRTNLVFCFLLFNFIYFTWSIRLSLVVYKDILLHFQIHVSFGEMHKFTFSIMQQSTWQKL